jgi:hypothetical protein
MDRLKLIVDELIRQFAQIESFIKGVAAQIPVAGPFVVDHIRLIIFFLIIMIAVIFIKPLLKWSIVIAAIGGLVALAISGYFGIPFLNAFPYSAVGVSILILSTK